MFAMNQDLNKARGQWFIQNRSLNEPISSSLIYEKAPEINAKHGNLKI